MAEMTVLELVIEREERFVELRFRRRREVADEGVAWVALHIPVGIELVRDSRWVFRPFHCEFRWLRTHGCKLRVQIMGSENL
jgi:hypothetical protein